MIENNELNKCKLDDKKRFAKKNEEFVYETLARYGKKKREILIEMTESSETAGNRVSKHESEPHD